jgi:hypothetical protein
MNGIDACPDNRRYLVVVVDDVGLTSSVNQAVSAVHGWNMVTALSLAAGGAAFGEAVKMVERRPHLSAGLHVMLSDGPSVLPHSAIPGLVRPDGHFRKSPLLAGLCYWLHRRTLKGQIEAEVEAQFDRFEKSGLHPTHVDCHHHLHMHPVIFDVIARAAAQRGVRWIRIPREPASLVLNLHFPLPDPRAFVRWLVFGPLTGRNLFVAHRYGLRSATNVYGLSATGKIDEKYLLALMPLIEATTSELYLHLDMGTTAGRDEMKAVSSIRVREAMERRGVIPVNFNELTGYCPDRKQAGGSH